MAGQRISILGVGLLGGSLGMAAKAAISDCHIIGYGHRSSTLDRALEIGAIDQGATTIPDAVRSADLIILCTPVGILPRLVTEMAEVLKEGAIVTDVGSTKGSLVALAERLLPSFTPFVGSHPMAGSEKRGVEFARPDLFAGALCILTPTPQTNSKALDWVDAFWRKIGMRTTRLTPAEHDRLLAEVSHLPHALAAALVAMQEEKGLSLCGKGFLDTTRIAGGDGELWRDIFVDNKANVKAALATLRERLADFERMLERGEGDELARWLNDAARKREELMARKLKEINLE